jgi:predicted TIM-barrel fold metal-dependent hydrolase
LVLPLDYYLPLYHHERYEPLWTACEELDLVVSIHAGEGGPSWYGDGLRAPSAVYMMEVFFYAHRPLWCFVFGGVFDRHPNLKVSFTEQGSSWVPGVLADMQTETESVYYRWPAEEPLAMSPAEYFHKHCSIGDSPMFRPEIDARHNLGVDVIMFGADIPHLEGLWPDIRSAVASLVDGIPEDEARAIMGGNLARVYRVDTTVLADVTERICPSLDDIGVLAG